MKIVENFIIVTIVALETLLYIFFQELRIMERQQIFILSRKAIFFHINEHTVANPNSRLITARLSLPSQTTKQTNVPKQKQ